jgi:hypothetical protein
LPFIGLLGLALIIITYVPALSTWIPNMVESNAVDLNAPSDEPQGEGTGLDLDQIEEGDAGFDLDDLEADDEPLNLDALEEEESEKQIDLDSLEKQHEKPPDLDSLEAEETKDQKK